MELQQITTNHWRISRAEMLYLLNTLCARNLVGVDQRTLHAELDSFRGKKDCSEIQKSLVAKKILLTDNKRGYILSGEIHPALDALFFPQRALFASRRRTGKGRQVICAAQKNKLTVMHSFPGKGEHSVWLVSQPESLFGFLVNWFSFFRLPISRAEFEIPEEMYKRIRAMASSGKSNEALALLETVAFDPEEKKTFIRSLANCRMSGTMAWMQINDGKIERADSIAVVSDGRTGWLISQDKPSTADGAILNVRRTGADLAMTVRTYVERSIDAKLPRLQTDPSGKFKRFSLTSDELAMALSAINCTDVAAKFYAETSGDVNLESYSDRMKGAQQSLIDSGLCILSGKKIPLINEALSGALFTIAHADWQIQITACGGGPAVDTGIYIARGQWFSAYYSYGRHLQVIESGKHEDAGLYIESLFPEFCAEESDPRLNTTLSFSAVDKIENIKGNQRDAERILLADGVADTPACTLAQDLTDSIFRATIVRNNPPDNGKRDAGISKKFSGENLVLILKSPRNSWLLQFHGAGSKGKAAIADRETFRSALVDLLI